MSTRLWLPCVLVIAAALSLPAGMRGADDPKPNTPPPLRFEEPARDAPASTGEATPPADTATAAGPASASPTPALGVPHDEPTAVPAPVATAPAQAAPSPAPAVVPLFGQHRMIIAVPDVFAYEIAAGGVTEQRDDWMDKMRKQLGDALARHIGSAAHPLPANPEDPWRLELEDVQSLLRAILVNDLIYRRGTRGMPLPKEYIRPYEVGSIAPLLDEAGADRVLFIFVRSEYSSGGRKAVGILAMIAGAAVGVAIIPQWGATVSSAALVDREGHVLWWNVQFGGAGDAREVDGARSTVGALLRGMPR